MSKSEPTKRLFERPTAFCQPGPHKREQLAGYTHGSNGERYPDVDYDKVYTQEELFDLYLKETYGDQH